MEGAKYFNRIKPVGSLYELSFDPNKDEDCPKLVEFICYCLNPNHFHFILRQIAPKGISLFMKRLLGGYTMYFNEKEKRSGALFQGLFKSKLIIDNDYLLHTSAYVNLNNRVHQLGGLISKLVRSSWNEYRMGKSGLCEKGIILGQFKNPKEYEKFALGSLELSLKRKAEDKELKGLMLE